MCQLRGPETDIMGDRYDIIVGIGGRNKKSSGSEFIIIGNHIVGKMSKNKEMRVISGISWEIKSTGRRSTGSGSLGEDKGEGQRKQSMGRWGGSEIEKNAQQKEEKNQFLHKQPMLETLKISSI